jgi:hypothetical protein
MTSARERHTPMVPFDHLQELIAALESDRPLDRETRSDIRVGFDCLYLVRLQERHDARIERPSVPLLDSTLYVAHALVTEHRTAVKAAIIAAFPGARCAKDIAMFQRLYRKRKAHNGFRGQSVDPAWIAEAVAPLSTAKCGRK